MVGSSLLRLPALSYRTKVAFLLSAVILVFGIIAVSHARETMRRILGEEAERRGEAIARELAANSVDLLLTDDLVGLYDLANRARMNDPDIRYVLIIAPGGEVRVNTFGNALPRGLLDANRLSDGESAQLRRLATEEGLVRDLAVGILGGRAGVVRVGVSDWSVEAAVARNTRELIALVIVAVAVGLTVSYGLSIFLTRPLTKLLRAVRLVARGDLSQRIISPAGDEVGQLGRAFNIMAGELESKEVARRRLMEQVISSQEEERIRVARELHDELAQRLTSALLSLEAAEEVLRDAGEKSRTALRRAREATEGTLLERAHASAVSAPRDRPAPQAASALLDLEAAEASLEQAGERSGTAIRRARRVTESSLSETRKLISDLRPTVLDDLGLLPAIRSYAESHLRPVETEVSVFARNLDGSLSPAMETAVFRIAQEAINNVRKHAGASRAKIALSVEDGVFSGEIADDGAGFRRHPGGAVAGTPGSGLGLQGMEERAVLLGGTLSIVSRIGEGTTVSFSIPLRRWQES